MDFTNDLITAFKAIGVTITTDEVQIIQRIGVDKYLSNIGHHTNEESLSGIYIIILEMREQKEFVQFDNTTTNYANAL